MNSVLYSLLNNNLVPPKRMEMKEKTQIAFQKKVFKVLITPKDIFDEL